MKKKNLIMIIISMCICGACLAGYMLKKGFAKADAAYTEVQIDDGFIIYVPNSTLETSSDNASQNTVTTTQESSTSTTSTDIPEATVIPDESYNNVDIATPGDNVITSENPIADLTIIDENETSSAKLYDSFEEIAAVNLHSSYSSAQGFDISGDIAYYIKINKASNEADRQARIYAYNMKTGKTSYVYNGNTSNAIFKIGHANCICIKDQYMYIATMLKNGPTIYRYTINNNGGKIYLNDLKKYTVYSHDKSETQGIQITGIHYAPELNGFFVKQRYHVYFGTFEETQFKWTKHYQIDTDLDFNTPTGTEKIDAKKYTQQGLFYKNGALFFPMLNSNKMNQSIVVRYPISASTPNESTLAEDSNTYIKITNPNYSKLFEFECIGEYNGEMYILNNNKKNDGKSYDTIIKIKDFKF